MNKKSKQEPKKQRGRGPAPAPEAATLDVARVGTLGNCFLTVTLAPGQSVLADGGTMIYMDGDVEMQTAATTQGGVGAMFGRWLAGESLFLNQYTNKSAEPKRIALGEAYLHDVVQLDVPPGEAGSWKASVGSFLAGTPNLRVSGKLNWRGFFVIGQQEGPVLTKIETLDAQPGRAYLVSYGHCEKHVLKPGQKLVVDNEHFLACKTDANYEIVKVGSVKSIFFSGEGFAMQFTGPGVVYTQSKGLSRFAHILSRYLPSSK